MVGWTIGLELTTSVITTFVLASTGSIKIGLTVRSESCFVSSAGHRLIALVAKVVAIFIDVVAGRGGGRRLFGAADASVVFLIIDVGGAVVLCVTVRV